MKRLVKDGKYNHRLKRIKKNAIKKALSKHLTLELFLGFSWGVGLMLAVILLVNSY